MDLSLPNTRALGSSELGFTPEPILEREFLALTRDLDLEAFWEENDRCASSNDGRLRCELRLQMDEAWLHGFLGAQSSARYYREKTCRDALHRAANALTREFLGRAQFPEDTWECVPRSIEQLFGCEWICGEEGREWSTPVFESPADFMRRLDEAEGMDLRAWAFPKAFLQEWGRRQSLGQALPQHGTGSRGPASIMVSVLSGETLQRWAEEHPGLLHRFSHVLAERLETLSRVLRDFSGCRRSSWWMAEETGAVFPSRLYRELCAPVVRRLYDAFASDPAALRSMTISGAAEHLLDILRDLGVNQVGFGPEVDVGLVRSRMPDAVIHGHMPPRLLRDGSPEEIRARVEDDFARAGSRGKLVYTTAGPLAPGTGVGRLRWLMHCVQEATRRQ